MMTRKEIKARAKAIIKQNYTASVVPFLLVIIATTAICFVTCMLGVPFMIPLSSVSVYLIYCMLWYGKAPVPQTPFIATFNQGYLRKLGGMLWMGLFSALWSMLGDGKELLGRVYSVGVACHLNIIHNKISENTLSENFAQNCRPFQMPELPGNIREIGCFKVAAKMLE